MLETLKKYKTAAKVKWDNSPVMMIVAGIVGLILFVL